MQQIPEKQKISGIFIYKLNNHNFIINLIFIFFVKK